MRKLEEIIICPICCGQEQVKYPDKEPYDCKTCGGKGKVWQVTNIYIEKIDKLHPKRLYYKGL
jgi:DnaJ-class molecular chaperone